MQILVYLKPEEVDIKEPPTTVNNIKNKDESKFDEYANTPDVEIDVVTAKKTFKKPSCGIRKK